MPSDPAPLTPLAPRDFLILLALAGGDLHGYGLVQEVTGPDTGDGPDRRYFRLTPLGRRIAASEAARASRLAKLARARKLLPGETAR